MLKICKKYNSLKGNKNAVGAKRSKKFKENASKIAKQQWQDRKGREKKMNGIKKSWTDKRRIEQSDITKELWRVGKLNSHILPHKEEHWNWNPDRVNTYRKGVYFGKSQRRRLLKDKCEWCGSTKNLQLDHILAIMNGGTNDDDNAQTLCRKCNILKRDLIDFRDRKNKRG